MEIKEELATCYANLKGHQERSMEYIKSLDKQRNRIQKLENVIRELLKGGEHEGECDNDQGMINEGGACQKHCDASDERERNAREALGDK